LNTITEPPGIPLQLTINVVIFSLRHGRLELLLIPDTLRRGVWSLPGRDVIAELSLDETASQVLEAGTGSRESYLEQLYTYGEPGRNISRREVAVVYFALLPADSLITIPIIKDVEQAAWFPVNALPELAMDHDSIISYALRRLRYKLEYSAVGFELLPEAFTLSELQHTYELILAEKLDKRNFRRRILEASIIEPTPSLRVGEGRPARLYRYRPDAVAEVKARRLFP
jgi:8-oxo-dGTP diphosphatase